MMMVVLVLRVFCQKGFHEVRSHRGTQSRCEISTCLLVDRSLSYVCFVTIFNNSLMQFG